MDSSSASSSCSRSVNCKQRTPHKHSDHSRRTSSSKPQDSGVDSQATRTMTPPPHEKDSSNSTSTSTSTETAWNWLRYVLVAVLVVSAITVAAGIHSFTSSIERHDFEAQFHSDAAKILSQVGSNFDVTMGTADDFMIRVILQARHQATDSAHNHPPWPMITIPGLAVQAAKLISQTNSIYMAFYPLIQAAQRLQWENFTRYNSLWVEEALQVQANNPHFHGPILSNYTNSNVIWNNEGPEPYTNPGPFLPSWMGSPVIPYYYPYNWNALAYDAFSKGLKYTLKHKLVVVTPVANHADPNDPIARSQAAVTSDWAIPYLEPGENPHEPFSDMYYPVLDTIDDVVMDISNNNSALGIVAFSFYWRHTLKNILPSQSKGLILVVTNPCRHQQFTYQIDGPSPIFKGFGDLHEHKFDAYVRSSTLANLTNRGNTYTGVPMSTDFCPFTLKVYPSSSMKDLYITKTPLLLAIGSAFIFILVTTIFCAYDFLIRKEFHSKQRLLEIKRHLLRFVRQEVQKPLHAVCHGLSLLEENMAQGATARDYASFLLDDEYVTQRTAALEHDAKTHLEGWLEMTRAICDNAGTSVDFLNDLLNYDQIQTGALNLTWNVLGASALVREVAQEFWYAARRKNVQIILDNRMITEEDKTSSLDDFQIVGDRAKLTQLLRNLISNGLKVTPDDSDLEIHVYWKAAEKQAMDRYTLQSGRTVSFPRHGTFFIDVKDFGGGMSQKDLKELFKTSSQIKIEELEAGHGNGLGLYISKGMAKHHGGDLQAFSEGLGKGTTFTLQLPLYHFSETNVIHLPESSSLTHSIPPPISTISLPTVSEADALDP